MLKKKLAVAIFGALMFNPVVLPQNNFLPAPVVYAEVKTIEADGYYIMGDGTEENQGVAKERARADAKRAASEQACTFVESISEIKNNNLTRDEIHTISATILKVISEDTFPEISGKTVMYHCHITVTADTSNVENFLKDRQKLDDATRQLKQLRTENERLQAEINDLNRKFATASSKEKKEIKVEVKRNEEQFKAVQAEQAEYWIQEGIKAENSYYPSSSIRYYEKAVEIEPNNALYWNRLAMAYDIAIIEKRKNYHDSARASELDYFRNAVECFKKTTQIDHNYAFIWYNFGKFLDKRSYLISDYGSRDEWHSYRNEVIEYFKKAVELNPSYDAAWAELGIHYLSLDKDKALECINKAIELNPENTSYKYTRDWILSYK